MNAGWAQVGIALTGCLAVFLTQSRNESTRRWACVLGLLGQPFWYWSSWVAEQWGIFAMCFLYTASWAKGAWVHWGEPWLRDSMVVAANRAYRDEVP